MPKTLTALADMFPNAKGTAFGIASFALAIGALPALLGASLASPICLLAFSLLSLASILVGIKNKDVYLASLEGDEAVSGSGGGVQKSGDVQGF